MPTQGIYGASKCCALTVTSFGYVSPFKTLPDGSKEEWTPAPFNSGAYSNTGSRGWIDIATLAESQRPEWEPVLLKNGYVLVKERMYNGVDAGGHLHNGGLVSMYIKEEKPEFSPNHPDFNHKDYVVEKHRIRSKAKIEESKQPGKSLLYGMTNR